MKSRPICLVLLLVSLALSVKAQDRKMKIYISADMEGVVGAVTSDQLGPQGFEYARFREFIREPDSQLVEFANATGLHMGQWLTVPMILGGLYLMATAKKRRERVEPIAGSASVA